MATKSKSFEHKTKIIRSIPNANSPVPAAEETLTSGATFQINKAKLCVLIATLSMNDNIKFLENIKQGLKRKISSKKYRSKLIAKPRLQFRLYD